MLVREYIKDFNKLVGEISFQSSGNEVLLKNKLLLIQSDIKNVSSSSCSAFEIVNFYSNIYNVINQSSETGSKLVSSCLEVLTSSINSRNKEIKKIVSQDINFLPGILKLLLFRDVKTEEESVVKLLLLLKDLLVISNDIDEHNTSMLISFLCDNISNSQNEKIVKLSLQVLSNLAMNNKSAKYLVRRSIKATEVQKKINQSDELVEMKFFTIVVGEILPKDFPRLVMICLKSIKAGASTFETEPILHSMDLLKYSKEELSMNENCLISEQEQIVGIFEELNDLLCSQMSDLTTNIEKEEFYDSLLDYYSELLDFDKKLVAPFAKFTRSIFSNEHHSRSSSALSYLSTYIRLGGKYSDIESSVETLIEYYSDIVDDCTKHSYDQKYAFLKFLSTLCWNERLDNTHYKMVLQLVEKMVLRVKEYKIESFDDQTIALVVYFLDALYALCRESDLFKESLDEILALSILPCTIAKAYMLQNEDILNVLFNLTPMETFPKEKVAKLLASSRRRNQFTLNSKNTAGRPTETSTSFSKYMNEELYYELTNLIETISRKVDGNKLDSLKASEIISLYRHNNTYLQAHLKKANESLDRFSDLCNEVQQQNAILSKLGEKHELMNWCLQLDKEKLQKENRGLSNTNKQLIASVAGFESKIEKEFTKTRQAQKALTLKTMEVDKLKAEKESMEDEKHKFKQAQKENETRIQQLKKDLEQEKQLRGQEVAEALSEQKKFNEKRLAAEKENIKLQEVITLSEKELMEKQKKIAQLENELREAEKIQASIMSLMQKSNKRN